MLARICIKPTDGKGHGPAGRITRPPDFVEANGEFACRNHRITAKAPGETDMRVFAQDLYGRIAEVTGNPGTNAERKASFDKLRGLLDMQLDKGPDRAGLKTCLAAPHGVGASPAFKHVFGKRSAGVDAPCLERSQREHTKRRTAADVGDLEPDTLLGTDGDGRDVAVRVHTEVLQRFERYQAGDDARGAIEVAAVGHRIEMGACEQARRTSVLAGQRHEQIGGMVALCFKSHRLGALRDQLVRELLAAPIAIAGYAFANTAASAQRLKERRDVKFLANHRLANV